VLVFEKISILTTLQLVDSTTAVADKGLCRGGGFGNPARTDVVWAYGRILCICALQWV